MPNKNIVEQQRPADAGFRPPEGINIQCGGLYRSNLQIVRKGGSIHQMRINRGRFAAAICGIEQLEDTDVWFKHRQIKMSGARDIERVGEVFFGDVAVRADVTESNRYGRR